MSIATSPGAKLAGKGKNEIATKKRARKRGFGQNLRTGDLPRLHQWAQTKNNPREKRPPSNPT